MTSGFLRSANRTVKLGDMQGSFYLLLFGLFISATILAGETYIFRRRKKRMVNSIQVKEGSATKTATNKTTPNKTIPNKTTPNKTTPNKTTPNITTPNKTNQFLQQNQYSFMR